MSKSRVYLAAPFFNNDQLLVVEALEHLILDTGFECFSPRLAENAKAMNALFSSGLPAPYELKTAVFRDNCDNIDTAPFMIAVIDGRDTGVTFEIGYAYRAGIPILTFTNQNFGMNLMLAQCTIGHCKGLSDLRGALEILRGIQTTLASEQYAEIIAKVQATYLTPAQLTEGP